MTLSRILSIAAVAAGLGLAAAANAVAEAEPEASEIETTAQPAAKPAPEAAKPASEAATPASETAKPASETAMPAPDAAAPAAEPGRVTRSAFTTAIVDREPTDTVKELGNRTDRVLYFTELRGFEGKTVVHRWQYKGEVMAEVPFQVNGPRWRVYSSKNLDRAWLGQWTVSVVADGKVLTSDGFTYEEAPPEPAVTSTQPASQQPAGEAMTKSPAESEPSGSDAQMPAAPADPM